MQGTYLSAGLESQFRAGENEGRWCGTRWCTGPMGVIRLGSRIELTRSLDLDLGLTHTSYPNMTTRREQGVEAAFVTVTWRPFRRD